MITGAYDEHGYTVYHENEPLYCSHHMKRATLANIRRACQIGVRIHAKTRDDQAGEVEYVETTPPGQTTSSTALLTVTAEWCGDPKPEPDRLQVAERRLTILLWVLLAAGAIAIALAYLAARRFWWA